MEIDIINKMLKERFSQPLPEHHDRRIIFWRDPDGEFAEMMDDVSVEGVKVLRLTGDNNFYAKHLLLIEDAFSDYLVYNPVQHSRVHDNWLHDIELMSEEFRADLHAMRMDKLNMKESLSMRKAVKQYSRFFENQERVQKLEAMGTFYESPVQLHLDVLSVLTGARKSTPGAIIGALLLDSLYEDENKALTAVRKFGNIDVLWEVVSRTTGWAPSDEPQLYELGAHIMITALSSVVGRKPLHALSHFITEDKQTACSSIIDEWIEAYGEDAVSELFTDITERYRIVSYIESMDVMILKGADILPCIDECIIAHYMKEIGEDIVKHTEILDMVESRRTGRWFNRFSYFYDGLYYIGKMQEFYITHGAGFHYGTHEEMWNAYCSELYLMDSYYRKFHVAFRKSLKNVSENDDLYKNIADTAERIYKNSYLTELNTQWNKLIEEDMALNGKLSGIVHQTDFYNHHVKPVINNGNRVFVIISDAFRYEIAEELNRRLIGETNGTAKLSAMQAVFPSVTKNGMASLLPHNNISIDNNMNVLVNGMGTDSTKQREQILKSYCDRNAAITYSELLSMKQAQRREFVSGAECVYIYHNTVDAYGDKASTESQVFEACEDAISELRDLVKAVVNTMSGSNIIITADHGFLYSYHPLEEKDKAERALCDNVKTQCGRRFLLTDKNVRAEGMMRVSMDSYNDAIAGFAPYECIRIKKQGGGMNYVHGGVSLQECVVPVITFKNHRPSSRGFVEITKVGVQLLSISRKISNSIFSLDFYQSEPVKDKVVAAEYILFFEDETGREVSDKQLIIADKTDENNTNRTFRVRFTLKSLQFERKTGYYLVIADKNTREVLSKTEYTIDIAFSGDFDF